MSPALVAAVAIGILSFDSDASFADSPAVILGTARGAPGQTVSVSATLSASSVVPGVAAVRNDFTYNQLAVSVRGKQVCEDDRTIACTGDTACIAADAGACIVVPDCSVNPLINKEATSFDYLPQSCAGTILPVSAACNGVRAQVFSVVSLNELIPDGSTLYTCQVDIAPGAADGSVPLSISNIALVYPNPPGGFVQGATGTDGTVIVSRTPRCSGDCNNDQSVTIDEITTLVAIALDTLDISECTSADTNSGNKIMIDEIVAAVNAALNGCGTG